MDPFETLGVPARFGVSLGDLEQRHRDLSRALHPDKHVSTPPAERRMLLSRAIAVNEAFRLLKNPVTRAEALLTRAGAVVSETSGPKPSPELLMEMMEARETLSEAARARDHATVHKLGQEMRAREAHLLKALGQALDDSPAMQAAAQASDAREKEQAFAPALALLGELRYTRRFLDEVSAFEELNDS